MKSEAITSGSDVLTLFLIVIAGEQIFIVLESLAPLYALFPHAEV
jgi:hypothetical protein